MPFTRYGRPGLLGAISHAAVIAGTASVTANVISREAAEAPPIGDDMVSQLRELARLRDAGALSQEEYATAKYRLLSN